MKKYIQYLKKKFNLHAPPLETNMLNKYAQYNIGVGTYGKPNILNYGEMLSIGKYCSIAPSVTILLGGNHRVDWVSTYPFNIMQKEFVDIKGHPSSKGPLVIENDVWIGAKSLILSGLTIGNGAVVASGSVVIKDVPPYGIVGGNPAKLIKMRFSDEDIAFLQRLSWWDKTPKEINDIVPLLMSSEINNLKVRYNNLP